MTGKYLDNMELKCSPRLNGGLIKMSAFIQVDYLRARAAACEPRGSGHNVTIFPAYTGPTCHADQWRTCGKIKWPLGIGSLLVYEWFLVESLHEMPKNRSKQIQ